MSAYDNKRHGAPGPFGGCGYSEYWISPHPEQRKVIYTQRRDTTDILELLLRTDLKRGNGGSLFNEVSSTSET